MINESEEIIKELTYKESKFLHKHVGPICAMIISVSEQYREIFDKNIDFRNVLSNIISKICCEISSPLSEIEDAEDEFIENIIENIKFVYKARKDKNNDKIH